MGRYVRVDHGPEAKLLPIYYRSRKLVSEERATELNGRVRDLRAAGLTYPMVAAVLELDEGLLLNPHEIRSWCQRLGLPTNPNKARPRAVAA